MKHNAETEACDLLMEIEKLDLLVTYADETTFPRVCLYLTRSVYVNIFSAFFCQTVLFLWREVTERKGYCMIRQLHGVCRASVDLKNFRKVVSTMTDFQHVCLNERKVKESARSKFCATRTYEGNALGRFIATWIRSKFVACWCQRLPQTSVLIVFKSRLMSLLHGIMCKTQLPGLGDY